MPSPDGRARPLWACPRCARQFAKPNQAHSCRVHRVEDHFQGRKAELRPVFDALILERAVRAHENRTKTKVTVEIKSLPAQAPLSVKIAVYRLIQESLANAYRHGHAAERRATVEAAALGRGELQVKVSDHGPGFDLSRTPGDSQLGLMGMRERVESLGGSFLVESHPGAGTTVCARLPLRPLEAEDDR